MIKENNSLKSKNFLSILVLMFASFVLLFSSVMPVFCSYLGDYDYAISNWTEYTINGFDYSYTGENIFNYNGSAYLCVPFAPGNNTYKFNTSTNTWDFVCSTEFEGVANGQISTLVDLWYYNNVPFISYNVNNVNYNYSFSQHGNDFSWTRNERAFSGLPSNFAGRYIWFINHTYFYSNGSSQYFTNDYTISNTPGKWSSTPMNASNQLSSFNGEFVWTDGVYTYYSQGSNQYIFNGSFGVGANIVWKQKIWSGLTNFNAQRIWGFARQIFFSSSSTQKSLDASSSSWVDKTWQGLTSPIGQFVWTDGARVFCSTGSKTYLLNFTIINNTEGGEQYNLGYNNGYNEGYNNGYNNGANDGYTNGYNSGEKIGYENGRAQGILESNDYSFLGLMGAIVDAPVKAFTGLFNFEVLGVNLRAFMMSLLTLCIVITVVKLVLGRKGD